MDREPSTTPNPRPPFPEDPVIEAYKRDVDRTLLRENLRLTHEERLLKLIDHVRFLDAMREAGRQARSR